MEREKKGRLAAVIAAAAVILLSFINVDDWGAVGVYAGCGTLQRFLYPLFHASLIHALVNAWCFLSVVFIFDISKLRIFIAYFMAITLPINALGHLFTSCNSPTVGLSGVVFVLFGSIAFEVKRRLFNQIWMLSFLGIGFLFPYTNAALHLYCYACGTVIALLNKPFKIKERC